MNHKKIAHNKAKILVVDDSPPTLEIIQRNLEAAGYEVITASNVEQAIALLKQGSVELVITDIKMPKISGRELLKYVKENIKGTEIMIITGYPSIKGAVEAVKDGAEDYLVKPFTDEELLSTVSKMLEKMANRRAVEERPPPSSYNIIGNSPGMQNVYRLIEKAAATKVNVLISGESGTGKELVARAIHYNSNTSSRPFVTVNCTAIPDSLLESELFGHVKGAFTGATASRAGFFQIADGGTLFLDEIGDASLNMQGKLLRAIQNKEIFMVGSNRVQKVDTRIIAATNSDLNRLVQKGLFREDLYFRLNIVEISLPPLHERDEDILLLLQLFKEKFSMDMNRPAPQFSDKVLQIFKNYRWQGNVRELENLIQRLVVLADGDFIDVADLPEQMRFNINWRRGLNRPLAEVEAKHIVNVLNSVKGNKTQAAQILGIDRKTLREKIRRANLLTEIG
ncbi:MAG: sigma-54-dependent Fis family transcriptional regulator [Deltaproteobacteria bacterium]|nr:MAG: sigma-54-dependent Fis family transcriptional regulator [Deltaproteobacteria bacterium]